MMSIRVLASKIWGLLTARREDREFQSELEQHLDLLTAEYVQRGFSPEEALRQARMRLGGAMQLREAHREGWGIAAIDSTLQDMRFSLRVLRKSPTFTAVAVLTIALAIGANTAVFSLINAVMLHTLPVQDPQRLVFLKWHARTGPTTTNSYAWGGCPRPKNETGSSGCSFSYPIYRELREKQDVFSGLFAFIPGNPSDVAFGGEGERAKLDFVSGNYFSILGVRPAVGRTLDEMDDAPDAPTVAVLSYDYWQRRFDGDPNVTGKTIMVAGKPVVIAGVAARGFAGLETGLTRDLWLPLGSISRMDERFPRKKETQARSIWLQMGARLNDGASVAQAAAAVSRIFTPSVTTAPDALFKPADGPRIELPSASHGLTTLRKQFSDPLFLLMAAAGLVLLVAIANVAGLMLARAAARKKEAAMRFALGASRGRVMRQLLIESLMLATFGAALGTALAYWGASSLVSFLAHNSYYQIHVSVAPDFRILAFTAAIACLVGVIAGLAPALGAARFDLLPLLKQSGAGAVSAQRGSGKLRIGGVLVSAQVALCVVALSAASLLARTLLNLKTQDVGFTKTNILLFELHSSELHSYLGKEIWQKLHPAEVQRRISALPGVIASSYSMTPLLAGGSMTTMLRTADGTKNAAISVHMLPIGPAYLETMRIPLLSGRSFGEAEYGKSDKVTPAVINQTAARQFFGTDNPLGRQLVEEFNNRIEGAYEVIGIAGDAKYDSLRQDVPPTAYVVASFGESSFAVRAAGDPNSLIAPIHTALHNLDDKLTMTDVKTQEQQIDEALYVERLLASLASMSAVLALGLACIGLYGLLAYGVSQRRREIGVRTALGADPARILRLVVGDGLLLTAAGGIVGLLAAAGVDRYLKAMLYGVKPADALSMAAALFAMLIAAAMAAYIPARRAAKVDPVVALRCE